jgi:quercetin dioxygenase-like cupin family protein
VRVRRVRARIRAAGGHAGSRSHGQDPRQAHLSGTTTNSGQPIKPPQGNVEVVAWLYDIPVGTRLPVHKHPFQRYAYVLSGTLRVSDAENSRTFDYKAGDFIVEMVDGWHYGANIGKVPVRLLVIDQVEPGRANSIVR